MDVTQVIAEKFRALSGRLDEATLRLWAAVEARALGHGGVSAVASAVGLSRTTIYAGLRELARVPSEGQPVAARMGRVRAKGGGRKKLTAKDPTLWRALDALIEPTTRGDPQSPLRWTCKSTPRLAKDLVAPGHPVSQRTVGDLLAELDYSLQATRKTHEGDQPAERDAQFSPIAATAAPYQMAGDPVVSVDTKQKERVGDFRHGGREWQPKGRPEDVRVDDFIDPQRGKVAPYEVYDVGANQGWVSVGITHDTATFAVENIRRWWREMGQPLYPAARRLLITADCGGSNGYRVRLWKVEVQQLADELGWRGRPLVSRAVVVNLIGHTTTTAGLRIQAPTGRPKRPSRGQSLRPGTRCTGHRT